MKRMIQKSLVISALVTIAALAATSAAFPAIVKGHIGGHYEGGTLCYQNVNRMIVRPPQMSSSAILDWSKVTTFYSGGQYGGGWHAQRVSYQAFLYRWNGSSWSWTGRYGPLYSGWTYDAIQPVVWDNNDMGGTTVFSSPGRGYFTVYLRLTWYADSLTPGGTREDFGRSYQYLNGVGSSFCRYDY
jgi:hypothetical protein